MNLYGLAMLIHMCNVYCAEYLAQYVQLATSNSVLTLFTNKGFVLNTDIEGHTEYYHVSLFWKQRVWSMLRQCLPTSTAAASNSSSGGNGSCVGDARFLIAANTCFIMLPYLPENVLVTELDELNLLLIKTFAVCSQLQTPTNSASASAALSGDYVYANKETVSLATRKNAILALKQLLKMNLEWFNTRMNSIMPTLLDVSCM
jgi:hypothetical protein